MSSVVIAGDTSGSVTLQAPAVAGTTVLTLPSTSGTLAIGSGALVFISSQTVSTAVSSVDFTSGISSTYDDYQIIFENMTASVINANVRFYLYQSSAFSTSYSTATLTGATGNLTTAAVNTAFGQIQGTSPSDPLAATTWRGNLLLQNVNSSAARGVSLMGTVAALGVTQGGEFAIQIISGASNTAAVVTGFRVAYSTGNIATGTVRLYGIAKS
jgi:hypothetical protein